MFIGDEVFDVDVGGVVGDLGAAVVAVLVFHFDDVFADDVEDEFVVGEDGFVAFDFLDEAVVFVGELVDFETDEALELHGEDGVGLGGGESHAAVAFYFLVDALFEGLGDGGLPSEGFIDGEFFLHQVGFGGGDVGGDFAVAQELDDAHDFDFSAALFAGDLFGVDVGEGEDEAFQDVGALAGFFEAEGGAAADNFNAMINEVTDHVLEAEGARLAVDQGDVDDGEGVLDLGVFVELVHDDVGVGVALELDDDADGVLAVGFVADVGDVLDFFVFDALGDLFDEGFFVDLVGDLGDDDLFLVAAEAALDADFATDDDAATAGGVGVGDALFAADDAAGGEVRAFDDFHEFFDGDVGGFNDFDDGVADFAEVVGREAGGHADGDALGAVDEEVGEFGGEDGGFFAGFVVVGDEVDGFFLDVLHHFHGGGGHAGFGVTHGGGGIAVEGAEVALAVDELVAHRPILGHADEGGVDDGFAVGVVVARSVAGDLGAFTMFRAWSELEVVHGDEDAALRRLEAVADVGERAVHDGGHGVGEVAFLEFVFDLEVGDAGVLIGHGGSFVG